MSYIQSKLTPSGNLIVFTGELNETIQTKITQSERGITSAEFDEISIQGEVGLSKREYSTGVFAVAGEVNEVAYEDELLIDEPGVYTWQCPSGISTVSVVSIGGGGSGGDNGTGTGNRGGGGGGLGWKNNISVIPGEFYTIVVGAGGIDGANGGESYFSSNAIVAGGGGTSGNALGIGGGYVGDGGGIGGSGGSSVGYPGGGGGAGGYSGAGGAGGHSGAAGLNGSGGGGGGGGSGYVISGGGGGGTGIFGVGTNGTGGALDTRGTGGSNGTGAGTLAVGGSYGGGGGGSGGSGSGDGANGAVRVVWSVRDLVRTFPNTNVIVSDTLVAQQFSLVTGVQSTYSASWNQSIRHVAKVTFASVTDMRNFFALSGNIRLQLSHDNSVTNSKDNSWINLINSIGMIYYTAEDFRKIGNVEILSRSFAPGAGYTTNYVQAWGELQNDIAVQITVILNDAAVGLVDESVTTNITSAVDYYKTVGTVIGPVAADVSNIFELGP